MRDLLGPWPSRLPGEPTLVAALYVDGSLASAVAAGWLARQGCSWCVLVPATLAAPAAGAAHAIARHFDRPAHALASVGPLVEVATLTVAAQAGAAQGAELLVLPLTAADEPATGHPLALRLARLEAGLESFGLAPLWAPLLRFTWPELGRLAAALALPEALGWDCAHAQACGSCAGCVGRRRARVASGRP